jgi:hypothetical protein
VTTQYTTLIVPPKSSFPTVMPSVIPLAHDPLLHSEIVWLMSFGVMITVLTVLLLSKESGALMRYAYLTSTVLSLSFIVPFAVPPAAIASFVNMAGTAAAKKTARNNKNEKAHEVATETLFILHLLLPDFGTRPQ